MSEFSWLCSSLDFYVVIITKLTVYIIDYKIFVYDIDINIITRNMLISQLTFKPLNYTR